MVFLVVPAILVTSSRHEGHNTHNAEGLVAAASFASTIVDEKWRVSHSNPGRGRVSHSSANRCSSWLQLMPAANSTAAGNSTA